VPQTGASGAPHASLISGVFEALSSLAGLKTRRDRFQRGSKYENCRGDNKICAHPPAILCLFDAHFPLGTYQNKPDNDGINVPVNQQEHIGCNAVFREQAASVSGQERRGSCNHKHRDYGSYYPLVFKIRKNHMVKPYKKNKTVKARNKNNNFLRRELYLFHAIPL
jgi:hypothetical protein